jgi:hypothetical protein
MSRTRDKTITTLVAVLATAALVPAASAASTGPNERTQTELGQAVGEPADRGGAAANARYSRTPTELGQRVATSVAPAATSAATDPKPSGFDWGDAGIGAAAMLALIALGGALGIALVNRRRHEIGDSQVGAVSG